MNHPPRCIHVYHPSLGCQPMTRQLNHKETQLRSCDLLDFLLLTPPEAVLPCTPLTSSCCLLDLKTHLGTTHLLVLSQEPGTYHC